jgi:hypothetical protein
MSEDPGFPHGGSDVQKAEFIFLHMGVVANKYGLKAGSGAGPRAWVIRVDRNFTDPENADSLKGCTGYGNCGEWSYAFSEILGGAGVVSRPVFAAKTCTRDAKDDKFTDTDTTVIVEEVLPNGTVSRRVFDTFRAAYHSGSYIGGGQPNSKELQKWGNLPLTNADKLPGESESWLTNYVGKPCIKDASSEDLLPLKPPNYAPITPKWTGTFVGPQLTYTLTGRGNKVTVASVWAGNPGSTGQGGWLEASSCTITGNSATCNRQTTTGEYFDSLKKVKSAETCTLRLSADSNTLTAACTRETGDETCGGKTGPARNPQAPAFPSNVDCATNVVAGSKFTDTVKRANLSPKK